MKNNQINKKSIKLNYKNFSNYNVIILLTAHNLFDQKKIIKNSNVVIDTRGHFMNYENKKIYSI